MARDVQGGDIYQKRSKVLSHDPMEGGSSYSKPSTRPFSTFPNCPLRGFVAQKKLSAPLIGMQSK